MLLQTADRLLIEPAVIKKGILYDSVLSHSSLCKFTCLASDFSGNCLLISYRSKLYILNTTATGLYGTDRLPLNLVVFLTIQIVNMVNAGNVKVAVPQNSFIHQKARYATETLPTCSLIFIKLFFCLYF